MTDYKFNRHEGKFLENFLTKMTAIKVRFLIAFIMLCFFTMTMIFLSSSKTNENNYVAETHFSEAICSMIEKENEVMEIIIHMKESCAVENMKNESLISKMVEISDDKISRDKAEEIMELVKENSSVYGFDFLTILAMIAQESNFISTAKSRADAKGLMQVTPIALADFNKHNGTSYTDAQIYDDAINVKVGCWTLNRQKHYIDSDDLSECIISYNSGASNFKRNKADYLIKYSYLEKIQGYEDIFKKL